MPARWSNPAITPLVGSPGQFIHLAGASFEAAQNRKRFSLLSILVSNGAGPNLQSSKSNSDYAIEPLQTIALRTLKALRLDSEE